MNTLDHADPNPPPGAPINFPVERISPTGLRLYRRPPYSRQESYDPLVNGIGIKIRKPTTWVDDKMQLQTWDDEWERRYPAWDCSDAGLFEVRDSGQINQLTYSFKWKSPGDHQPSIFDMALKYPSFGMPFHSQAPVGVSAWARTEVGRTRGFMSVPRHMEHFLRGQLVIPARLFNQVKPGTVNETDFGLIGDKVSIQLPRLRPDCPTTLAKYRKAGHFIPEEDSLYAKTEKLVGFEYRTQLLGVQPGTATTVDPNHKLENVKFENLWFILLFPGELPTYHFWLDPKSDQTLNQSYWPALFDGTRHQPINRSGAIRRTGAIHLPIYSSTPTSWGPSDRFRNLPPVPPLTRAAVPQPQPPVTPAGISMPEGITARTHHAPTTDQDIFRPSPHVRYQEARKLTAGSLFRPSPTFDLFSHNMTTRRQAAKEPDSDDIMSPVQKKRKRTRAAADTTAKVAKPTAKAKATNEKQYAAQTPPELNTPKSQHKPTHTTKPLEPNPSQPKTRKQPTATATAPAPATPASKKRKSDQITHSPSDKQTKSKTPKTSTTRNTRSGTKLAAAEAEAEDGGRGKRIRTLSAKAKEARGIVD